MIVADLILTLHSQAVSGAAAWVGQPHQPCSIAARTARTSARREYPAAGFQNQTMTASTASKTSEIRPARKPASKYERLHVGESAYQRDEEPADCGPIGCVVIG